MDKLEIPFVGVKIDGWTALAGALLYAAADYVAGGNPLVSVLPARTRK